MKTKRLLIFLLSAIATFTLLDRANTKSLSKEVHAQEIQTTCPREMTPQECIEFLNDQIELINSTRDELTDKLDDEALAQLSLSEKISYYNGIIADAEANIEVKKLELEKKNVEATLLHDEIDALKTDIDTASQEIKAIEDNLKSSIALTYKSSRVSLLDIIFGGMDLTETARSFKFLERAKEKTDADLLEMNTVIANLNTQNELLNEKQVEVESKLLEIDMEKDNLEVAQANLQSDKYVLQVLLAESKEKEEAYKEQLASLQDAESKANALITKKILEMHANGEIITNAPVTRGQIVGVQGHTGLAYGSHLHFELYQNGISVNPFSSGYLSGGSLYGSIGSSTGHAPLDSGILTYGFHGNGYAIDAISASNGDQSGGTYNLPNTITCYGMSVPPGDYPLRGEGAAVRTIADGFASAVRIDDCGGKYVLVNHGNGLVSLYLHLK